MSKVSPIKAITGLLHTKNLVTKTDKMMLVIIKYYVTLQNKKNKN